jgi:hypothetical protein
MDHIGLLMIPSEVPRIPRGPIGGSLEDYSGIPKGTIRGTCGNTKSSLTALGISKEIPNNLLRYSRGRIPRPFYTMVYLNSI